MAKREKIIIGLMILALLYGVLDFFVSSSPKEGSQVPESKLAETRDLAARIADNVQKESLTGAEKLILERAGAEWTQDPFLGRPLVAANVPAKTAENEALRFVYTGFIEAGNKRLAIINGMEYQAGEELESGAFVVRSISQASVMLENAGRGESLEVPFAGEKF
jgi:type II secretory pathway component PulC